MRGPGTLVITAVALLANIDTDGTPGAGIFLVSDNAGGVVDVANLTAVGASNTD